MDLVMNLTIFVLAAFVGFEVISKVPNTLHTPLMSGTNAIHGIVVLGGLAVRSVTVLLTPLMPLWDLLTWANYEVIATYPVYIRSIYNTILIALATGQAAMTLHTSAALRSVKVAAVESFIE